MVTALAEACMFEICDMRRAVAWAYVRAPGERRCASRLLIADLLVAGMTTDQVAVRLRVMVHSVRRWGTALACGGELALGPKARAVRCAALTRYN